MCIVFLNGHERNKFEKSYSFKRSNNEPNIRFSTIIIDQNFIRIYLYFLYLVKITFKTFLPFFEMSIVPFLLMFIRLDTFWTNPENRKLSKKHKRNQLADVLHVMFQTGICLFFLRHLIFAYKLSNVFTTKLVFI